eukprot:SAG31_NODE_2792_length_5084_cov_2.581745_2_plen_101_part_00
MWLSSATAALLVAVAAAQEAHIYTQPVAVSLGRTFAAAVLDEGNLAQKIALNALREDAVKMMAEADDVVVEVMPWGECTVAIRKVMDTIRLQSRFPRAFD